MKALYTLRTVSVLMVAGVILAGCLDEKHDRITKFEPGVYLGKPDTQLSNKQRDVLVRRARLHALLRAPHTSSRVSLCI